MRLLSSSRCSPVITLTVAALFLVSSSPASAESIDDRWNSYLQQSPQRAVDMRNTLASRADSLVEGLSSSSSSIAASNFTLPADIDVVCSGGGFLDFYYMGVAQILSRLETKTKATRVHRYAGASAGGMTPFQWALSGENSTVDLHFAFGIIQEDWPETFGFLPTAAYYGDHLYRIMAPWMLKKAGMAGVSALDDKVFLALSCLDPLPKLVKVSNYTSLDQAEHAFMGTGTIAETYDGMLCSDGGAESGKKMTPLFQDKARPQLIVDLMETGFPISMVSQFNVTSGAALVKKGQDEMVAFLRTGASRANVITLCPPTANVDKNVCEQ